MCQPEVKEVVGRMSKLHAEFCDEWVKALDGLFSAADGLVVLDKEKEIVKRGIRHALDTI